MRAIPIPIHIQRDEGLVQVIRLLAMDVAPLPAAITAAYTVQSIDDVVRVDATGGAITVTLPPVATVKGLHVTIKRLNAGANNVTIDATGAELIDGALTFVLTAQYQVARLYANGTSWDLL